MLRAQRAKQRAEHALPDGQPLLRTFFHSSLPSTPDDRAQTLRKIDEIEAQMASTWWRPRGEPQTGTPSTQSNFQDTKPTSTNTDFRTTAAAAIEVREIVSDPALEEAAIRFANGDSAAAEQVLRDLLRGPRSNHADTWLTLFALYRASGMREQFDHACMDFLGRFERSPPPWPHTPHSQCDATHRWLCPATLDSQSIQTLLARIGMHAEPLVIDWSRLTHLEPSAHAQLHKLLNTLSLRRGKIHFFGTAVLEQHLATTTQSSRAAVHHWHLLLVFLRLLGRQDEFEQLAIAFCVTFDTSPPSWKSPQAQVHLLDHAAADRSSTCITWAPEQNPSANTQQSDFRATSIDSTIEHSATIGLSGDLRGQIAASLRQHDKALDNCRLIRLDCANLQRIDFEAAGELLNWADEHHRSGKTFHFLRLNRLIALFFGVVGIAHFARISVQND